MPPLPGFSDNSFTTYQDFRDACTALLVALEPYHSSEGARIKLPLVTGTHFDDVAAQLEGYARPLWAIGALMHSETTVSDELKQLVANYAQGLASGTDPSNSEYWGPVIVRDQRMVEMEIISFALLAAPHAMFHSQTEAARANITAWLKTINGKDVPVMNWLWFRIMTNLALVKVCGVSYEEVREEMKADLDHTEEFYLSEGWSADGIWSDHGRQADYYSGSFAIQFSQLLYAKMAQDIDPERCDTFRSRAREFALSFWRYFDSNGAAIPFGRSLTYRFAFAGFWSAVAFAKLDLPAPLNDVGVVKGLLLRHFRWWSTKSDMFNVDGSMTIGFTYPNMYLSEDYNSAQSVYWAMKSFLALGLPENDPFWTVEEKHFPIGDEHIISVAVKPPMQILCNTGNHHFLLSAGQFCPWPLKATEAKYGKFAYSSHFGFSVPTGPLIQQMAPDSTLALSKDGGDTWRVPWKLTQYGFGDAEIWSHGNLKETCPMLRSTWVPWKDADIVVKTALIAPSTRWPNWYVRVHKITNQGSGPIEIHATQGGFAIQGRGVERGEVLPVLSDASDFKPKESRAFSEGTLETDDGVLICSNAGASGIKTVPLDSSFGGDGDLLELQKGELLKPDANTNLMWQRTLIPALKLKTKAMLENESVVFGSAVFAMSSIPDRDGLGGNGLHVTELWRDLPVLVGQRSGDKDCISIDEI